MNRRHLIIIGVFAGAFLALGYLGWALLIKPVDAKIVAKAAERDAAQQQLTDAKSQAAQYDKFRAQAENVRRDLGLISQRLDADLSQREESRIIDRIMTGAGTRAWKITTMVDRAPSKIPGFTTLDQIPITYEFDGGYHELGEIFNRIVSNARILCPESIEINDFGKDDMLSPSIKVTSFVVSFFVESKGAAK
jgi:Tfp pilus assembly protein PilO